MPKVKISEYSTTNADNTDIEGINIAEGCAPSGINNAIRELMVHLKEFQTGASGDGFTFAGGTLMTGTNTLSGTNVLSGSTTAAFAAGSASAPSVYASGDTNTGIFFPAADTIAIAEGGVEVARVNSSGNVGIGTDSPGSKLDVKGTLRLSGSSSGYVGLAPAAAAGSTTYTLPSADGSSGQVLSTNGSGTLSWATVSGGGGSSITAGDSKVEVTDTGSNGTITFTTDNTERGRFTAGGYFKASNTGSYISSTGAYHEFNSDGTGDNTIIRSTSASLTGAVLELNANRNTTNNTFYPFSYYNNAAGAYRFRVADSGAIATAGSITLGSVTAATSGIGVQFPATQSASSDANTLDDYEEGTWTPTLVGSSTAGTYTFSTSYAYYTKIGRQVTVIASLTLSTATGGSGEAKFGGLPFTKSGNQSATGAVFLSGVDVAAGTVSMCSRSWSVSSQSTEFGIISIIDNSSHVWQDISGISSGDVIDISLTYFV